MTGDGGSDGGGGRGGRSKRGGSRARRRGGGGGRSRGRGDGGGGGRARAPRPSTLPDRPPSRAGDQQLARVFVALNLPVHVVDRATQTQRELRSAAEQHQLRVAWVPPPNMHITLKFLGDVERHSLPLLGEKLTRALQGRPAIPISLSGLGAFPEATKPRVLWMGLGTGAEALAELAAHVDESLSELGFERETRAFHGHLTLGRVKKGAVDLVSDKAEQHFGDCLAREVTLYESRLQRKGAEYNVIVRIPLASS